MLKNISTVQFDKWNSRLIETINQNHTEEKEILDFSKLHFSGRTSLKEWEIYFTVTRKCAIFFSWPCEHLKKKIKFKNWLKIAFLLYDLDW